MAIDIEEVKRKFQIVHGNKYDYSRINLKKTSEKVEIICPIHGAFHQWYYDHLKGCGCSKCSSLANGASKRLTTEEFIKRANITHIFKYDYSSVVYKTSSDKVQISCPIHGIFDQLPSDHLSGKGCLRCQYQAHRERLTSNTEEFIKKAKKIHGELFDYSKVNYINGKTKVEIICDIHGSFLQLPNTHLNGKAGCPSCGNERKGISSRKTTTQFIEDARKVHGDKYDYDKVDYTKALQKVTITCPAHGDFEITPNDHTSSERGCPSCSAHVSKAEIKLEQFLDDHDIKYIRGSRKIISPLELDFYLPEYNLAIEHNGIYYHSENVGNKLKYYHLNKTKKCEELGIRLIHILETEMKDFSLIKSRLRNILGLTKYKLGARKCIIKKISKATAEKFVNKYHMEKYGRASVHLGMFYKNRLVQVGTFAKVRNTNDWKFEKVCSLKNFIIVGGVSKILKHFKSRYTPDKIVTFSDRRWNSDGVYDQLNFRKIKDTPPNYWYFDKKYVHKLYSRHDFTKKVLDKKLATYNSKLSEKENMIANGYDRIWDCGYRVFESD